ncbi:MAG: TonB-dependent receptor [Thermoanaerobaculia bacterium]
MMQKLLVLIGILGGVVPLVAQTPQSQPTLFEEAIVVTASLDEEQDGDIPAAVSVIKAVEIEARQTTEVAALLASLPAMTVVQSGSPGQVTSLFTRGTNSDQTLVLWNGVELNDPYFGGFNWAFMPTEGVGRVEAVRGPFSSLYGGDALGGVVQILSAAREGADLQLEGGENSYWRGQVSASTNFGSTRVEVAGHLRRGDGQVDNDFFDGESLMARAEWEMQPGMSLGVLVRAADADTGIPFSGGAPSPERRISWQERLVAVPFRVDLGDWQVQAQVSGLTYDNQFRDPEDLYGFTASDTESESMRARAVASYSLGEGSWLAVGSEWDRAQVSDTSTFGTNLDGENQGTVALFGEAFYRIGRVILDAGVRQDDNDVYGSETSPRLGIQLAATKSTRMRASWGQAFSPPSIGELYFPVTGNPELEPETSDSLELGVEQRLGDWVLAVTGFQNDLSNLIEFDFASYQNVNIGSARTQGVELEAGFLKGRWRLRWNGTLLETEDLETGQVLLRRPRESSNLVVSYAPEGWSTSLTGLYVGDREDVDPITFDRTVNEAYFRLDVAARWRPGTRLAPYARIENLLGEEYQPALGFPAPGRTLVVGVATSLR